MIRLISSEERMTGSPPRSIGRPFLRGAFLVWCSMHWAGGRAQTFYFNSGPISQCDTSIFTANVSGIGQIAPPGTWWGNSLGGLGINITTDHPQTLQIILTSPSGTNLLLSAFNGAGGQNYTNTVFDYWSWTSITTGAAPFTGNWQPQGGPLSLFDWEFGDGTWTITVIDTACANGGTGPGGTWTPGWFDGTATGSGFNIYFNPPPPCPGWIPSDLAYICPGGTVDILGYYTAFGTGYTFTIYDNWWWGTLTANPSAVSSPGTYYIDAYDTWTGCTYQATFDVYQAPSVALGPDQTVSTCPGAPPSDLMNLFNWVGTTQAWTLNGAAISTAIASAATAPGVYELIATNANGCSDTAVATLNYLAATTLGPDQSAAICQGSTLDLTGYFATAGLTTTWTLAGIAVPDPTTVASAGSYMLVGTNASGCADTAYITLSVQANPSLGPDQSIAICSGTGADLTTVFTTVGYGTAWTQGGVSIPAPYNAASAGAYTLVVSTALGCKDTAVVDLMVDPTPSLGPDQSQAVCDGASFDLTSAFTTTGLTTTWTESGASVALPSAVTTAGAYQLVVANSFGCTDTAVVALAINSNPSPGADRSFELCPWQSVDLTGLYSLTGLTATYLFNDSAASDPTAAADEGTYLVNVVDANGCAGYATVSIDTVHCLCEARIESEADCLQDPAHFTAVADSIMLGVEWDLGGGAGNTLATETEVYFPSEGYVVVTLTANLACGTATAVDTVHVVDCSDSCRIFIPSAFTPDGDGMNAVWTPQSDCIPEAYLLYIFNRWGELIHTSSDPYSPWDGSYNGTAVQEGVYVYRLVYRMPYQDEKLAIGHVTLLR